MQLANALNPFRKRTDPYKVAIKATDASRNTAEFVAKNDIRCYCEIGCNVGATARLVAEALPATAEMHLFDIQSHVENTREALVGVEDPPAIHYYGNTLKLRDSYCWKLVDFVRAGSPRFDYVFIDGSHDLTIDGFAFLLLDRLLEPGAYVEFDDYAWSFGKSATMKRYSQTSQWYTPEQIETPQIGKLIDSVVRTDDRYTEIRPNRLFRKESA